MHREEILWFSHKFKFKFLSSHVVVEIVLIMVWSLFLSKKTNYGVYMVNNHFKQGVMILIVPATCIILGLVDLAFFVLHPHPIPLSLPDIPA